MFTVECVFHVLTDSQFPPTPDKAALFPSFRYYVTDDNIMYMASEVGVVNVAPENVIQKASTPGIKTFFLVGFLSYLLRLAGV